ncbi:Rieske 2Fe-2S domain-containing protein [Polaribacter litorisediminis]|uniref:Rieske 2Fe-2S domain-containing protein n=1 Tax=Polaribacter litorisediminis TaxID=1908341 RepID=UPI001CBBEF9B|nr:Rieske 2Fe-2S domain-containing protein [Polaribacter litorisediminis]UAM99213.1 Rieske 2Fe-2S domain-containing protein [Polaribacter litorisediminis]
MNTQPQWYPIAILKKLSAKPKCFMFFEQPIVVYKGEQGWIAQKDCCPHRNYPLSKGKIVRGKLQCGYHGWQFDYTGNVTNIPGLKKQYKEKTCILTTYSTHEHNGLLWVCLAHNSPFYLKSKPLPDRKIFSYQTIIIGKTADILENFLDPMHTSFLHNGLIRSAAKPHKTTAEVRAIPHGVEIKYTEESHQSGIIGTMFGRFITHSYGRLSDGNIIDLEFYSKKGLEMTNRFIIVPGKGNENYFFSQITASKRWVPPWLKVWIVSPLFLLALRQDKKAIKHQFNNNLLFQSPKIKNTYLDLMRPYIDRMLAGEAWSVIEKDLELYI